MHDLAGIGSLERHIYKDLIGHEAFRKEDVKDAIAGHVHNYRTFFLLWAPHQLILLH